MKKGARRLPEASRAAWRLHPTAQPFFLPEEPPASLRVDLRLAVLALGSPLPRSLSLDSLVFRAGLASALAAPFAARLRSGLALPRASPLAAVASPSSAAGAAAG